MKRAILFDLDGTLIDSAGDLTAAIAHLLAEHGLAPHDVDTVRAMTGDGASTLIARVFEGRGATVPEGALERFRAYYAKHGLVHTRPYPGIPELLQRLRAARPRPATAVVTNKPHALAEPLVEALGLAQWVDLVVGPEQVARKKPDPDHPRTALARLGVAPEDAVMVGDGDTDVLAGKAAGILTVAVAWGFRDVDVLRATEPDHLVFSVEELGELLFS